MTVVGIAGSVSTPGVEAWMSPTDIIALSPGGMPAQQMLYRVSPSATAADITTATTSITRGLPVDSVLSTTSYLDLKAGVDRLADLYVPVLLAFSVFALLAAAFTIANVVTGIVLTGYRDIAVMKAVGFTPVQIVAILVGQMLLPVAIGAFGGVIVGTLASQHIVEQTAASFGLPAGVSLSLPVIAAVLGTTVLAAVLAAIGPAVQAGRLSPIGAMSRGSAPSAGPDGGRLRRLGMQLPVRLPIRLGVAAGVAHPVRASMTLGALVVGVAALTFALGLNWSLLRVFTDLNRNEAAPVRAEISESSIDPASVTAAIAASPQTRHVVAASQSDTTVPGLGAVPFVGYDGDASWIGYALINGRWFSAAGEAVAPTNFFTRTGMHVGDSVVVSGPGGSATVRLVGEIFDNAREARDNLVLRGAWTDLVRVDPTAQPSRWEAQPVDGVDPQQYRSSLGDAIGRGVAIFVASDSSNDESFLLFLVVVTTMGAVLVAISLGGVFNTVLLETRQRTREMAVLKAIGLTPAQGLEMVLWSVVPVGIVAGLAGLPIGILCQRLVLTYMGEVAAKTAIPAAVFDVFTPLVVAGLALAGLGIGLLGAVAPAQRAARLRIAPVLQAE
jgi:putative ABC transport system permease protein